MILTLTASIMYWSLQQQAGESETGESNDLDASPASSANGENDKVLASEISDLSINDAASDATPSPKVGKDESSEEVENTEPSSNTENGVTIEGSPSTENERASSHVEEGGRDTE